MSDRRRPNLISPLRALQLALSAALAVGLHACASAPAEPKFQKFTFPKNAFVGDVQRPYVALGPVRSKIDYQSLDFNREERELCRNYYNRAVRDLVKFAKRQGADAVVDVKSVTFLLDGRTEMHATPECSDDGGEGQVLTQGIAVKWKENAVDVGTWSVPAATATPAPSATLAISPPSPEAAQPTGAAAAATIGQPPASQGKLFPESEMNYSAKETHETHQALSAKELRELKRTVDASDADSEALAPVRMTTTAGSAAVATPAAPVVAPLSKPEFNPHRELLSAEPKRRKVSAQAADLAESEPAERQPARARTESRASSSSGAARASGAFNPGDPRGLPGRLLP